MVKKVCVLDSLLYDRWKGGVKVSELSDVTQKEKLFVEHIVSE